MNSRTALFSLLAFALLPSALLAQTQPDPAQEHEISGTVVNSVTHQPIARALVNCGQNTVFTDREGRFRFADINGQYPSIAALKPGYSMSQSSTGGRTAPSAPVIEQISNLQHPLTIELTPEAILFGTVTDSAGVPLPGVDLTLYKSQIQSGLKRWQQAKAATTNAEGEFRIADLAAGEYQLSTQFHLENSLPSGDCDGYLPARYPEDAGSIALAAGQQKGINLVLPRGKFYLVTGPVNEAETHLGMSIQAWASSGEEMQPPSISRGRDKFAILLPNGSYRLRATSFAGLQPLTASASVVVNGKAVNNLALTFSPLAIFPIEIEQEVVATNNHSPDAPQEQGTPPLHLISLEPSLYTPAEYYSQPTNSAGDLAFSGVTPGRYLLTDDAPGTWHITSATCGSADLMREPLVVTGGAACTLHVVVSNAAANLSVTTKKEGKPTEATVYLLPVPDNGTAAPELHTTGDGATASLALAAGRYDMIALDGNGSTDLEYRNLEIMQRYSQYIRSITLAAGQTATVQLDVAPSQK